MREKRSSLIPLRISRLVGYLATGAQVKLAARAVIIGADSKKSLSVALVGLLAKCVILTVRVRFKVRILGGFPEQGCVAVSLHDSFWDGVLVATMHERLIPVTTSNVRSSKIVEWFLQYYRVIWTKDDVVPLGSKVLQAGGIVWIAPYGYEGNKSKTLSKDPRSGAARIAIEAWRPIVCVSIEGINSPSRRFRRRDVCVQIGEPIFGRPGESPAELTSRYVRNLHEIRRA